MSVVTIVAPVGCYPPLGRTARGLEGAQGGKGFERVGQVVIAEGFGEETQVKGYEFGAL